VAEVSWRSGEREFDSAVAHHGGVACAVHRGLLCHSEKRGFGSVGGEAVCEEGTLLGERQVSDRGQGQRQGAYEARTGESKTGV
jgi:hypothetical protein